MKYWLYWHNVKHELSRKREQFWIKLAYMIPRPLAYWATIRVGAHASTGQYGDQVVPEMLFMDVLKRWDEKS